MDARSLIAQVLKEAGRLGLSPVERIVLILAVALLSVLGPILAKRAFEVLRNLKLEPQPVVDEGGAQPSGDGTDFADPASPGGENGGAG